MGRKSNKEALKALDIVNSLGAVTKEKSIGMELVLETLKDALVTAARKYLGELVNVEAKIDKDKGTIEVYTCQKVVEEVTDPEFEISLEDALELDDTITIGSELTQDLDINLFGRTAVQSAKQVIIQRVREAERDRIFSDYSERIGELVTGTIQQIERGNVLVNLGRTEALMPYREQIRKERLVQGASVRACIVDVRNSAKGPQVIISRTHPDFLARLFELEVPEIFDKTVKIVKVVRNPGHRSKIAVTTSDSRVDPVGACVGMRGNRVQAIVRELCNERIDIINWTDELTLLVRRVFAPAEVKKVIPVGEKKIVVVINEDDLAQAIGREGQNIRLASDMLEREIDVFGDEEFTNLSEEQRTAALSEEPAATQTADAAEDIGAEDIDGAGGNVAETDDESAAANDGDAHFDETLDAIREEVKSETKVNEDDHIQNEIINDAALSLSATDDDAETAISNTNNGEV